MMRAPDHVVLLGDSIFDNGIYVLGHPDVVTQLRTYLPESARATLLATDGHRIDDVHHQLRNIPARATHLILSVGGNDALDHLEIIDQRVTGSGETLERLHTLREAFGMRYRRLLTSILSRGVPAAACTIYEGNLDSGMQRRASTALTVFNDAILRIAFEAGAPVIDLRLVCSSADCYANPIEPSSIGGDRIAQTIAELVTRHDFTIGRTVVYGGASSGIAAR